MERGLHYQWLWETGEFFFKIRICKRRLWKWASLSIGDPFGNQEGGLFTRGLWERDRWRALEKELSLSLSLSELCEGNLEVVLLYLGPWRICKGRLWKHHPLSIGIPLGNLGGDFKRWTQEGSGNGVFLSMGALQRTWRGGGPPLGTLMDMYRKALERAIFLHRGPVGGHGRDAPLPGLWEKGENF